VISTPSFFFLPPLFCLKSMFSVDCERVRAVSSTLIDRSANTPPTPQEFFLETERVGPVSSLSCLFFPFIAIRKPRFKIPAPRYWFLKPFYSAGSLRSAANASCPFLVIPRRLCPFSTSFQRQVLLSARQDLTSKTVIAFYSPDPCFPFPHNNVNRVTPPPPNYGHQQIFFQFSPLNPKFASLMSPPRLFFPPLFTSPPPLPPTSLG